MKIIVTLLALLISTTLHAKGITLTCKFKDKFDGEIATNTYILDTDSSTGLSSGHEASVTWSPIQVKIINHAYGRTETTIINRETLVATIADSSFSSYKPCKMEETTRKNKF